MKSLKAHNEEALKAAKRDLGAGVTCDECGIEMRYLTPGVALACDPPKHLIWCPQCKKTDYKY